MDWQLLITALVGISGAIGGSLVTAFFNRDKVRAEVQDSITERWQRLADERQEENIRLQARLDRFEGTVADIRKFHDAEIRRLELKYGAELARQNERIAELEAENEALANTQENNNAQTMKLQYGFIILSDQVRQLDREPVVDLARIESMTVDDLKRTAQGIGNANERRRLAKERKAANE